MSSCICCGSIVLPPPVSWSAVPCQHLNYPACLVNSTSWSDNPLLPSRSLPLPSGLVVSPGVINSFSAAGRQIPPALPPALPPLALSTITPSQTGQLSHCFLSDKVVNPFNVVKPCYPSEVAVLEQGNSRFSDLDNRPFDITSSRKRSGCSLNARSGGLEGKFLPCSSTEEGFDGISNKRRRFSYDICATTAKSGNLWSFPPSITENHNVEINYIPPPIYPSSSALEAYPSLVTLPVLEPYNQPFYHQNGFVPSEKKIFTLPSCVDLYPPTPPKESGVLFKGRVNFPVQANNSDSTPHTFKCKPAVITKILGNLLKSQSRFSINIAEMQAKQDSLMWNQGIMRKQLVLWIHQLNCAFNYHSETAYIAVYFVDKYLSRVKVTRSIQFYVVSTTAFYLAAKTHEEDREPRIQDIADCSRALGKEIFRKEIQRMERKMMSVLEYDLLVVTPYAVIAEIMKSVFWFNPPSSSSSLFNPSPLSQTGNSERVNLMLNCAYSLIELTTKYLNSMEYSPALLAAVALGFSMDVTDSGKRSQRLGESLKLRSDKPWWRDSISLAGPGATLEKVESCWQWIKELVSSVQELPRTGHLNSILHP